MRTYQVQAMCGIVMGPRCTGKCSLPEPEVKDEAADHADDGAGLGGVARERAEEEDAEQAAVGDGRDGEADLDDVAFAAGVDGVDGDGEEDQRPETVRGLREMSMRSRSSASGRRCM